MHITGYNNFECMCVYKGICVYTRANVPVHDVNRMTIYVHVSVHKLHVYIIHVIKMCFYHNYWIFYPVGDLPTFLQNQVESLTQHLRYCDSQKCSNPVLLRNLTEQKNLLLQQMNLVNQQILKYRVRTAHLSCHDFLSYCRNIESALFFLFSCRSLLN